MKLLKETLNKVQNNIGLTLLVITTICIGGFAPSTYWSFVDDGEMIEVSQRMSSTIGILFKGHILQWLTDPQVGRFRPAYWFYHWLVYTQFGISHFGHGLIQFLLILVIVIACYLTALKISGSKVAGFLAGILFVANTLNQENWYRLGPQEAPLIFFLALSVLFMVFYIVSEKSLQKYSINLKDLFKRPIYYLLSLIPSRNDLKNIFRFNNKLAKAYFFMSIAMLFPAYFMKENSLAFVIFPVMIYIWSAVVDHSKKLKGPVFFYMIWNLALLMLARYGASMNYRSGSYASDYILTFQNIKSNFTGYATSIWITFEPLLITTGIYLIFKLIGLYNNRKITYLDYFVLIFGMVFLSFFMVQLPWEFEIPRYLFPGIYFFSICLGILLSNTINGLNQISKDKFLRKFGLNGYGTFLVKLIWFLVFIVTSYNLLMIGQSLTRIYGLTNNFNKPLISNLANNVKENGTVVLDTPPGTALELKQEIGLHLRLFFNRPDIKVIYFDNVNNLNE